MNSLYLKSNTFCFKCHGEVSTKVMQDLLLEGYEFCSCFKQFSNDFSNLPNKICKEKDFNQFELVKNNAFLRNYNLTFLEFARNYRMGKAFLKIKNKYTHETKDLFFETLGAVVSKKEQIYLYSKIIKTPLGKMYAISTNTHLVLLEFTMRRGLEREILNLRKKLNGFILSYENEILNLLENELNLYFALQIKEFKTPILYLNSQYVTSIWHELRLIKIGETKTYEQLAIKTNSTISQIKNANGLNQIAILIPCHRVLESNSNLGGYGGGLLRKEGLLKLEKRN